MTFSKIYDFLGNFFQPCTIDDRKVAIVKNVKSSLEKIFSFYRFAIITFGKIDFLWNGWETKIPCNCLLKMLKIMAFFRNDTICRMIPSLIFTYTRLTNEKGNWDDSQTVSPTLWKNLWKIKSKFNLLIIIF